MERVITGKENPIDPRVPEGALAEFYRAFNSRYLVLMAQNWDDSEEASMDNPLGGIRRAAGTTSGESISAFSKARRASRWSFMTLLCTSWERRSWRWGVSAARWLPAANRWI